MTGGLEPTKPTREALRTARMATLKSTPSSPEVSAWVNQLAVEIEAGEKERGERARTRKAVAMVSMKAALGAFLGDLLRAADDGPHGLVYRSLNSNSFSDGAITYDGFRSASEGLEALGFVESFGGYRRDETIDWGDGVKSALHSGFAARSRATPRLLFEAERRGIAPPDLDRHFAWPPVGRTPKLVLNLKTGTRWSFGGKIGGLTMPIPTTAETRRLTEEVVCINAFLADMDLVGAGHGGFHRSFAMGDAPDFRWNKGGRLYSYGADSYQRAKPSVRRAMTIDGKPVVEIDVKASHLTILYALAKVPLDIGEDAYADLGIDRDIAKAWLTATLGKGSPVRRWPKQSADDYRARTGSELSAVCSAKRAALLIESRYPLLKDMGRLEVTWADLMFLESQAIMAAMHQLMEAGIRALPVHDSLIVAVDHRDAAVQALMDGYAAAVGVQPHLTITEGHA